MKTIDKLYKEWQALQPLSAENQKRLDDKYMLEFNYNSNHIEGNTLTYGQTKLLLFFGKIESEEGTPFRDFEEMKAHAAGLRWIKELAANKEHRITEHEIKQLNHIILAEDFYKKDENGNPYKINVGQYKTRSNSVRTITDEIFTYASPEETSAMMYYLVKWLGEEMERAELSPIELAALLHYRYIRIHPFEDGNGRVARLLVTYVLERYNYPMVIIKSKDKEQYLNALNRADVNVGLTPSDGATASLEQIAPFVEYITRQAEWSLSVAIAAAKGESIDEAEDWKKKLTLKLGDKKGAPLRTNELGKTAFDDVYKPLIEKTENEISTFYPLFKDNSAFFDSNNQSMFTLYFTKSQGSMLYINIEFTEENYTYIIHADCNNGWNNSYDIIRYEKRYDHKLSDDEIKEFINAIGKVISDFTDE